MKRVAVAIVVLALLASACGSSTAKSSDSQNPDADTLQVSLASFDLAAGPPARVLFGLNMGNGRFVGFGSIEVTLSTPGQSGAAPHTANFILIPGADVPRPAPTQPEVVNAVQRGVYEVPPVALAAGTYNASVRADVKDYGELTGTTVFQVATTHGAVAVGEKAPASANPTIAEHGKLPLAAVDSRAENKGTVPDPILHQLMVKDALAAHRPIVVAVSTPVYCVSRFCGPVTDMVADLARQYGKQAAFVHIEVWADFASQSLNAAAVEWIARGGRDGGEPWVFVVGSDGIVKARFDNVVTEQNVIDALKRVGVSTSPRAPTSP